jgi:hypothetical protein
MALHGYSMFVDLIVEGFTEGDGVAGVLFGGRSPGVIRRIPKAKAVEKMKTRRIDQRARSIDVRVFTGWEDV